MKERISEKKELENKIKRLQKKNERTKELLKIAIDVIKKYNIYVNPITASLRHDGKLKSRRDLYLIEHQVEAERMLKLIEKE